MSGNCRKGPSLCMKEASHHTCASVLESLLVLHPSVFRQDLRHQFFLPTWGLSSPFHPAAWPPALCAPRGSYLSMPPIQPISPSLTVGELLSIKRQRELRIKKILFSLSQYLSVAVANVEIWMSSPKSCKYYGAPRGWCGCKEIKPCLVGMTRLCVSRYGAP